MPAAVRKIKVPATSSMDTETFVRHFNARHDDSLAGMKGLPLNISFEVEESYRAFHLRLHATETPDRYEHEHRPETPEARIERALGCLADNGARGWYEIASARGVACVFPGGRIATRVLGKTRYHDDVESAARRLVRRDNGRG